MSATLGVSNAFAEKILSNLQNIEQQTEKLGADETKSENNETSSFYDHLSEGIDTVNMMQKIADGKATELASGKSSNIHETMLAATQAELTFNLMVQLRNKALEAYIEVMRMPV